MSTTSVALFGQNTSMAIPAYLAATADSATNALAGGLGEGRNRIGLKGARFRLIQAGQEIAIKDEPYLDVVIVGANAAISRTFYAGKYDPTVKTPPACFSANGVTPAATAESPQASKCATCPKNEKGSAIRDDGSKGRACAFSKRVVITLPGDAENTVYQLDVKALSLFGDGHPAKGLYTMSEYAKLLANRGVRAEGVVTRLSFDTDSSVPKLFFTPQAFVTEADLGTYVKLSKSPEVKAMLEVSAESVDLSGEVSVAQPVIAAIAAVAAPAPKPAPKPKPAPVVEAPAAPAPVAAVATAMDDDLENMLDGLMG